MAVEKVSTTMTPLLRQDTREPGAPAALWWIPTSHRTVLVCEPVAGGLTLSRELEGRLMALIPRMRLLRLRQGPADSHSPTEGTELVWSDHHLTLPCPSPAAEKNRQIPTGEPAVYPKALSRGPGDTVMDKQEGACSLGAERTMRGDRSKHRTQN